MKAGKAMGKPKEYGDAMDEGDPEQCKPIDKLVSSVVAQSTGSRRPEQEAAFATVVIGGACISREAARARTPR